MSLQEQIIAELKVKPSINEEEEVRKRVDFLKTYVKNAGAKGLLIAISGGIDSAVATALAKSDGRAYAREQPRVQNAWCVPTLW